jgi:hypothetical protein
MNGGLEMRQIELDDDGQYLNVKLEIHNPTDRTLHFYRDVRGVKYDEGTKTVRLWLTDRYMVEGLSRLMIPRPPLRTVDAGETETVSFRVARIITQLGPQQPGKPGPTLKQFPIHEAEVVEIELSWSDRPFYPEPGERRGLVDQLRAWEQGVTEGRVERRGKPPASSA